MEVNYTKAKLRTLISWTIFYIKNVDLLSEKRKQSQVKIILSVIDHLFAWTDFWK